MKLLFFFAVHWSAMNLSYRQYSLLKLVVFGSAPQADQSPFSVYCPSLGLKLPAHFFFCILCHPWRRSEFETPLMRLLCFHSLRKSILLFPSKPPGCNVIHSVLLTSINLTQLLGDLWYFYHEMFHLPELQLLLLPYHWITSPWYAVSEFDHLHAPFSATGLNSAALKKCLRESIRLKRSEVLKEICWILHTLTKRLNC